MIYSVLLHRIYVSLCVLRGVIILIKLHDVWLISSFFRQNATGKSRKRRNFMKSSVRLLWCMCDALSDKPRLVCIFFDPEKAHRAVLQSGIARLYGYIKDLISAFDYAQNCLVSSNKWRPLSICLGDNSSTNLLIHFYSPEAICSL